MNFLNQYKGLRKENYVLFFGRIVTNLGSMIWPVLTLILTQKMQFSATQAALIIIVAGCILIPTGLLGGKVADKCNKKYVIIYCDLISVALYVTSAFLPLSFVTVGLIIVAAACQSMEQPSYNALIADITYTEDRERAYSLQYLGSNIGLVASPMIAGFLFNDFLWLSFLISGLAIGLSTIVIFFFLKNITPVEEDEEEVGSYQKGKHGESLVHILMHNKVILLYIMMFGIYQAVYQQYAYLMPLDLGRIHGENGAMIFGSVSSLNCISVVIFTPIITKVLDKVIPTRKNLYGYVMLMIGYLTFLVMRGNIPFYYVAIIIFTFGEILTTISNGPYLSARIPESHRGRIHGFLSVVQGVLQATFLLLVGVLYDAWGSIQAWGFVLLMLGIAIFGAVVLIDCDKRRYRELYQPRKKRRKRLDKTKQ